MKIGMPSIDMKPCIMTAYKHTMSPEKKPQDDKEVVNNLNQSIAEIIRTIFKVTLQGVKPVVNNL